MHADVGQIANIEALVPWGVDVHLVRFRVLHLIVVTVSGHKFFVMAIHRYRQSDHIGYAEVVRAFPDVLSGAFPIQFVMTPIPSRIRCSSRISGRPSVTRPYMFVTERCTSVAYGATLGAKYSPSGSPGSLGSLGLGGALTGELGVASESALELEDS